MPISSEPIREPICNDDTVMLIRDTQLVIGIDMMSLEWNGTMLDLGSVSHS